MMRKSQSGRNEAAKEVEVTSWRCCVHDGHKSSLVKNHKH